MIFRKNTLRFTTAYFLLLSTLFLLPGRNLYSASESKTGKCFMWEVRSPSAKVYILGSMHFCKPGIYPLNPAIMKAYEDSEALILEIEMTPQKAKMAALLSIRNGIYPGNNDSIEKHISPEAVEALRKYLKSQNMKLEFLKKMKPWYLSMLLSVRALQSIGLDNTIGIDNHFASLARRDNKKIMELETVKSQIKVFTTLDRKEQEIMLVETLYDLEDIKNFVEQIDEAWKNGNTAKYNEITVSKFKSESLKKKIISDRNIKMTEKIELLLKGKGIFFVVVGGAHLTGPLGIINLLEKTKKYKITQVPKI